MSLTNHEKAALDRYIMSTPYDDEPSESSYTPPGKHPQDKQGRFITSHGMARTRIYQVWASMVDRCTNPKTRSRSTYGWKGITVCARWRTFENFYADMGECPEGKSLDRVDNGGPYCKENCRWATLSEQQRNRDATIYVEYNDERITLAELSERVHMDRYLLYNRITRRGWTVTRALTQPIRRR